MVAMRSAVDIPAESLAGRVLAAQAARRQLASPDGLRAAASAVVDAAASHRCDLVVASSRSAAMIVGVAVALADGALTAVEGSRVGHDGRVLVVDDTAVSGAQVASAVEDVRVVAPHAFVAVLVLADQTRPGRDGGWRDAADVVVAAQPLGEAFAA